MLKLLEEMQTDDIDDVLTIIESHDEDDAEEAEEGFRGIGGCMDMYVLRHEGKIIGVTGFSTPPGCDQTHWLSWTYVHDDYTNKGFGRKMLSELIDHLKEKEGRMLFVKVSDYVDEEDGAIYAAALHLYQALGFKIELTHPDYYDEGESEICLGLRLRDTPAMVADIDIAKEEVAIQFNAVFEIAETDNAYTFGWDDEGEQVFNQEDVTIGLDNVREQEGRMVFLSFPSNYNGVKEPLLAAGFKESGKLHNYYEDGIHDQHYTYKVL
ncbi:MAG TPA: GNAT family N-acetyltransferase [Leucothrix sp.]|nr:GNAT family N-acetyltransferase [Leucothrix sp.]